MPWRKKRTVKPAMPLRTAGIRTNLLHHYPGLSDSRESSTLILRYVLSAAVTCVSLLTSLIQKSLRRSWITSKRNRHQLKVQRLFSPKTFADKQAKSPLHGIKTFSVINPAVCKTVDHWLFRHWSSIGSFRQSGPKSQWTSTTVILNRSSENVFCEDYSHGVGTSKS